VRFVENLTLIGTGNINGTGNALNNVLIGNAGANILSGGLGNDTLNGGLGADTMLGGNGNDTYFVDNVGDRVFETTTTASSVNAGGTDLINSSISFNLDAYTGVRFVENLTLIGTGNINGTGNALNNVLIGNAGANILSGGLGNDRLFGGNDRVRDTFDFNNILDSRVGSARDLIYNFISGIDKIDLSGIDAKTTQSGDQAFTFNGTTAKANAIWFKSAELDGNTSTRDIVIYGDVNGNLTPDFEIGLIGVSSVVARDFIA
jgi:serralysin